MKKLIITDPYRKKLGKIHEKKNLERKIKAKKRRKIGSKSTGGNSTSEIIDYFLNNSKGKDRSKYVDGKWRITIPEYFSFITNPNKAIDVLYSVCVVARKKGFMKIWFDHRKCKVLDLGASTVLDILVLELTRERPSMKKWLMGGYFSEDEKVNNLLKCTGLLEHLAIPEHKPPLSLREKFIKLDLIEGYKSTQLKEKDSQAQETASERFAKYFSECFKKTGYILADEGQSKLMEMIAEVIDNAERHSGFNQWFAMAYMDQSSDLEDIGECQLTIFSFGRSIYQSFKEGDTLQETLDDMKSLATRHRKREFFSPQQKYSEEDLWTMYSLQDGVSSTNSPGKGTGTIKMIDAFQKLGDSVFEYKNPEMVLVSGSSRIFFDKTYQLQEVTIKRDQRQIIAFNDVNSLEERPNPKHVHSIDNYFPGTLLNMKFFMDKKYLKGYKGAEEQ